jgi:UTP--glucose-1-phosphate uridylyltransferase
MRAVVTLAGEGTRMLPWTRGLRKEFLPLFDRSTEGAPVLKPVAHLVLETLLAGGADEVTLVVGGKDLPFVQNYFTVDREFLRRHADKVERLAETRRFYRALSGLRFHFAIQASARGFGDALLQAEPFVGRDGFVLHAGDAVLLERERGALVRRLAELQSKESLDVVLLVRRVADPRRYGVIEGVPNGRYGGMLRLDVTGMEEKPARPRSHWAATAAYAFSPRIFEGLHATRRRSRAKELEVTDAIRWLLGHGGKVAALVLAPQFGEWRSVGSPEGYLTALQRSRQRVGRPGARSVVRSR